MERIERSNYLWHPSIQGILTLNAHNLENPSSKDKILSSLDIIGQDILYKSNCVRLYREPRLTRSMDHIDEINARFASYAEAWYRGTGIGRTAFLSKSELSNSELMNEAILKEARKRIEREDEEDAITNAMLSMSLNKKTRFCNVTIIDTEY
jgi:hypothetical protein